MHVSGSAVLMKMRWWCKSTEAPTDSTIEKDPALSAFAEAADIEERGRLSGEFARSGLMGPIASIVMAAFILFFGLILASPPPAPLTVQGVGSLLREMPTGFVGKADDLTGWTLGMAGVVATMFIAAAMDRDRSPAGARTAAQAAVVGDFVAIAAFTGSVLAWLALALLPWTLDTLPNKVVISAVAVLMGSMAALLDSPTWRNELARRAVEVRLATLSREAVAEGVSLPRPGETPGWRVLAVQTLRAVWRWSWPVGLCTSLAVAVVWCVWQPLTGGAPGARDLAVLLAAECLLAAACVGSRVYRHTERIYAARGARYVNSLIHLGALWVILLSLTVWLLHRSTRPEWVLLASVIGWGGPALSPRFWHRSKRYRDLYGRSLAAHVRRHRKALVAHQVRMRSSADRFTTRGGS